MKLIDCPDSSCSRTNMLKSCHLCSTFQCLVQIHTLQNNVFLNYSASNTVRDRTHLVKHNTNDTIMHLPLSSCHNLCTISIEDTTAKQINLTVEGASYIGPTHYLCLYGGFFYFEMFMYQHTSHLKQVYQSDVLCSNSSASSSVKRTVLSSTGSIFISVFSYKEISFIEVTLRLQETKCRVIHLCSCVNQHALCPGQPFANSVNIRQGPFGQPLLYFDVQTNHCIVLKKDKHFFHRQTRCFLKVFPKNSFQKNSHLEYFLQGSFSSLFSHFEKFSSWKSMKNKSSPFCDELVVQTSVDDMDVLCWLNLQPDLLGRKCFHYHGCLNGDGETESHLQHTPSNFRMSHIVHASSVRQDGILFAFTFIALSSTWFDLSIFYNTLFHKPEYHRNLFDLDNHILFYFNKDSSSSPDRRCTSSVTVRSVFCFLLPVHVAQVTVLVH